MDKRIHYYQYRIKNIYVHGNLPKNYSSKKYSL